MKIVENKVGRPKLADSKLKKESILVSSFVICFCVIIAFIIYKTVALEIKLSKATANICNKHINSCIVENNSIHCGPNVSYLKYKIGNSDYIEINKSENNIKIEIPTTKGLKYCYKTVNSKIICK